jgi:hypothetical protein
MNVFNCKVRKVCSQSAQSFHIPSKLCDLCAGLCVLCGLRFLNTLTYYKFRIPKRLKAAWSKDFLMQLIQIKMR